MEFVHETEIEELIRDHGLRKVSGEPEQVRLEMEGAEGMVHLHLACPESGAAPNDAARVVQFEKSRLPKVVEHIMHLLNFEQVLLIPVGKWRKVFDAVAFSLAGNEDWQAMDATATVELNTRDPLLCDPGDFHTVIALIEALLSNGETSDQGLMLVPIAAPVLVEIVPDGAIRVSLGNEVLADEMADAVAT